MPQTFAILEYGNLRIIVPLPDANNVVVTASPTMISVSVNGQLTSFDAKKVFNVTYIGSQGGSDNFVDNTALVTLAFLYGGHNTYTAGSNYNFVYFYGDDNVFNGTPGKVSDVFCNGGIGDVINKNGATVQVYP